MLIVPQNGEMGNFFSQSVQSFLPLGRTVNYLLFPDKFEELLRIQKIV